ncbi:MAG: rane-associated protein [Solirubrobacterales bacterium]|nr:rane-associated protein [Solirubrobacterales bacterium]
MRLPATDPALPPPPGPETGAERPPVERQDRILGACLVLVALYGLALTPVAPSLVGSHPVLLEILRGSPASMITAGGHVRTSGASPVVAVLAGVAGCIMFDWLYWWAGRRWGERAIELVVAGRPRTAALVGRLQRAMHRRGDAVVLSSYLLPVPTTVVDVIAGWAGMSLPRFLVLDAISASLWVGALVGLGYAIGQPAVDVANAISRYGLYIGLGLIVVVVIRSARRVPPDGSASLPE